ncbi:Ser/Thr protein phosphatase, putative [Trichomonas vaginalis G3]|uniref:Serine/threonine-protein phosphatase n=1 Tax=Trichomonas vaginalis (strain ATCC PRA-98 / G3) TaxID=412133 RepID=A2FAZ0_TRIV3|nr:serine threonine-protein phosphatase family [Trichomonas vaginalis G3]EAX97918.1 Ser/Thr protein phosphatase, putative [Trichomonas vaginalis G3]KAI5541277.1 serine threonine-protein phosphatase family [Trichomonas vaginalis G3]|eukprot:XP_001310848.1 Ser/Thr protein phosphatase [Trichomonas vaginalis G3]
MVDIDLVEETLCNLEHSLQLKTSSLPNLEDIEYLCEEFQTLLSKEENIVENLAGNFIVVGDLHGNFNDLIYIMRKYGHPSQSLKYLFLGDYVDRGCNSLETILYLISLKLLYPKFVTLIRGNHEFIEICKNYGFYEECNQRLGEIEGDLVFEMITGTFPYLPLAAILPNRIFAVHGGISSHIYALDDIRNIDRFQIEKSSDNIIATDLVWGDPRNLESGQLTSPSERGLGENYSLIKTIQFLKDNQLNSIIRAHEPCADGYHASLVDQDGRTVCLTVFSASNYCELNNMAAVAIIKNGNIQIEKFVSSSDEESESLPISLPMDLFSRSILVS